MRAGQTLVGHPVNVATGTVYSTHQDISLPAKVAWVWQRRYSPALLSGPAPGPLGLGWTTPYFASLTCGHGEFRFMTPEGDIELFTDPEGQLERGGVLRNLGT